MTITAEQWAAASEGQAVAPVADDLIELKGADTADFLNRMLTVDCKRLVVGETSRAFLLDARGRIQVALRLLRRDEDTFWASVCAGQGPTLIEGLDRYHFGERYAARAMDERRLWVAFGARPQVDGAITKTDRVAGDAWAIWGAAPSESTMVPAAVLEARRILDGVPEAPNEYSADITPLDVGRAGITEGKGCYPGQEVIERTIALGKPARVLRRARVSGALGGDVLSHDGAPVGRLTSVATLPGGQTIGLALIKRRFGDAPGPLSCGDARITLEGDG